MYTNLMNIEHIIGSGSNRQYNTAVGPVCSFDPCYRGKAEWLYSGCCFFVDKLPNTERDCITLRIVSVAQAKS
jgi:hypothetical protein